MLLVRFMFSKDWSAHEVQDIARCWVNRADAYLPCSLVAVT